jgi:hypothetical protein
MDEPLEIERRGAAAGSKPMFGEWRQTFDLEPVSYANSGNARAAFKAMVREQLTNKYVFVGEISLRVVLNLDEQKMLETPSYGDIDNHPKQLLDTIKGHGGLPIDDCQVQNIDIFLDRCAIWRTLRDGDQGLARRLHAVAPAPLCDARRPVLPAV